MSEVILAFVVALFVAAVLIAAIVANRRGTKSVPVDAARLREVQAEWRGPEELLFRSTPRNVRYTGSARTALTAAAVAGGAVVVIAAFLVPAVLRDQRNLALLDREGIPANGTITRRWTTSHKSETNYHVAYTYEVDGRGYASVAEVSKASHDGFRTGGAAGLHYAPSRPEFSRLDASVDHPPWIKLLVIRAGAASSRGAVAIGAAQEAAGLGHAGWSGRHPQRADQGRPGDPLCVPRCAPAAS